MIKGSYSASRFPDRKHLLRFIILFAYIALKVIRIATGFLSFHAHVDKVMIGFIREHCKIRRNVVCPVFVPVVNNRAWRKGLTQKLLYGSSVTPSSFSGLC